MAYLASISPYKQRKNISQLRSGVEAGLQQLKDFDFSVENPYEDMTVNLQTAQLQQQGLAQEQADILAGLRGAGGGAGGGGGVGRVVGGERTVPAVIAPPAKAKGKPAAGKEGKRAKLPKHTKLRDAEDVEEGGGGGAPACLRLATSSYIVSL